MPRPRYWPDNPAKLLDPGLCPDCFTPLSSPFCQNCGLDLSGPEAADLMALGVGVVTAEEHRQQRIHRMRQAQAARAADAAAQRVAAGVASAQPSIPAQASAALSAQAPSASAPPQPKPILQSASGPAMVPQLSPPADPPKPRRSSVQILMLTIGVVLVSVMAIFFLLLAYVVASLEVRSIMTAAAGIGVIGVSWLLRARGLRGTAEGIAVVAIVLLALDVWIVRANALFGTAALEGWLYAGIAFGILTAIVAALFRLIPLRAFSISAMLFAVGTALSLGIASAPHASPTSRSWLGFTVLACACLLWPVVSRLAVEKIIIRAAGSLGAAVSLVTAASAWPSVSWGPSLAFAVTAAVMAAYLVFPTRPVSLRVPPSPHSPVAPAVPAAIAVPVAPTVRAADAHNLDIWKTSAAVGLGLASSGIGLVTAITLDSDAMRMWFPSTATALIALALSAIARGLAGTPPAKPSSVGIRYAALIATGLAFLATLPALGGTVLRIWVRLSVSPYSLLAHEPNPGALSNVAWPIAVALLAVGILSAAVMFVLGYWRSLGWAPLSLSGIGALAASFAFPTTSGTSIALAVTSIVALAAFALVRRARSIRIALAGVSVASAILLPFAGLASSDVWVVAASCSLLILVALRVIVSRTIQPSSRVVPAVIVTGILLIATITSARIAPSWVSAIADTVAVSWMPALSMTLTAIAISLVPVLAARTMPRMEGALCSAIAVLPLIGGIAELATAPTDASMPRALTFGALVVASLVWQFVPAVRRWPERIVAAIATPAALALLSRELWFLFGDGTLSVAWVIWVSTTVVSAGLSILLFRPPAEQPGDSRGLRSEPARIGWDTTTALAAAVAIPMSFVYPETTSVLLLLAALVPLLLAFGEGDIVAGTSPRRHIAWLAAPLAVASLWASLVREGVSTVEAYSLPVAALLVGILLLVLWRGRLVPGVLPAGRNMLLASAAASAILPSAMASYFDAPWRPIALLAGGISLVVIGTFIAERVNGLRLGLWLWLAGAASAGLAGLVRAQSSITTRIDVVSWELWAFAGAASAVAAGALWLRRGERGRLPGIIAVAAGAVILTIPSLTALGSSIVTSWMLLAIATIVGAFLVIGSIRSSRAHSSIVRWTATACGVFLSIAGLLAEHSHPFEAGTVPLATALIISGALQLRAEPSSRSWPHLGPGIALLLVPSYIADFVEPELWRVVTLGVVALAVLLIGVARKLQAPTVLGATVLALHGTAQLWPWISALYVSVAWWLWAGIAGVILIVLAARYEQRINNLKSIARSISSLR